MSKNTILTKVRSKALLQGELKIGNLFFSVANLDDGRRVIGIRTLSAIEFTNYFVGS